MVIRNRPSIINGTFFGAKRVFTPWASSMVKKGRAPRKNSVQPEIIGKRVQIIFLPQIL